MKFRARIQTRVVRCVYVLDRYAILPLVIQEVMGILLKDVRPNFEESCVVFPGS